MEITFSFKTLAGKRANLIAAYTATIYYVEIILLMFALLFLYGKLVSILSGIVLALLLTYHIIQLSLKNGLHRRIQLYIIDVHGAFAAGYCAYNAAAGIDIASGALPLFVMRLVILACELFLFYFLTRDDAAALFR